MPAVQVVRAIVRAQAILASVQIKTRPADSIRNASYQDSLERGIAQVGVQIRQRDDQLTHHTPRRKHEPSQDAAESEHLSLQSPRGAKRDRLYFLRAVQHAECLNHSSIISS